MEQHLAADCTTFRGSIDYMDSLAAWCVVLCDFPNAEIFESSE